MSQAERVGNEDGGGWRRITARGHAIEDDRRRAGGLDRVGPIRQHRREDHTICRSASSAAFSCRLTRSYAGGSCQPWNGAPLRSVPGPDDQYRIWDHAGSACRRPFRVLDALDIEKCVLAGNRRVRPSSSTLRFSGRRASRVSVRCLGPVPIVSPIFILSGHSQPARGSNSAATSQVATAPAMTSCSCMGARCRRSFGGRRVGARSVVTRIDWRHLQVSMIHEGRRVTDWPNRWRHQGDRPPRTLRQPQRMSGNRRRPVSSQRRSPLRVPQR